MQIQHIIWSIIVWHVSYMYRLLCRSLYTDCLLTPPVLVIPEVHVYFAVDFVFFIGFTRLITVRHHLFSFTHFWKPSIVKPLGLSEARHRKRWGKTYHVKIMTLRPTKNNHIVSDLAFLKQTKLKGYFSSNAVRRLFHFPLVSIDIFHLFDKEKKNVIFENQNKHDNKSIVII